MVAYLEAWSPVVLSQFVILQSELIGLCISIPSSISLDVTSVLSRRIVGSELDHGDARFVFTIDARGPVDADIKFNSLESDSVVDLDVAEIIAWIEDRDLALGDVVEFSMDVVQDQDSLLVILR